MSPKIPWLDRAALALFDKFARSAIKTGRLRFVLPNGEELCYGDAGATAAPVPKGAPRCAIQSCVLQSCVVPWLLCCLVTSAGRAAQPRALLCPVPCCC